MSSQPVKRLSSLEIDEVSLVDRPANQHGLVTITKRDEGAGMAVYDAQGNEVDESQLQSGDTVYDENGEGILLLSDEDLNGLLEGEIDPQELGLDDDAINALLDENELEGVGKAAAAVTGGPSTITRITNAVRGSAQNVKLGYVHGRTGVAPGSSTVGNLARRSRQAGAHVGRNKNAYIAGAAAGTEENVRGRFGKAAPSLSEEVLSELSKALTDNDQHQVISKVAQRIEQAEQIAKAAEARAQALEDQAEFVQYVELAKSFELPVDPEDLGGILQEVSKVLSDEQLEVLERIFNTAAAAIDLEERGSAGYSPTMGYVGEVAHELVGKSAGDITPEQASTALFSANDEAYLEYLSEQRG